MQKLSYKAWLQKAGNDLAPAKLLVQDSRIIDVAMFHTQQCGEKSLKAYLAFQGVPIIKTHDLEKLIEECVKHDASFESLLSKAVVLSPYATEFRYPDDCMLPDKKDVDEAIEHAEEIFSFVQKKLNEK